jgi:ABC-2 type transport system permease protein/sodium transport system permease protein
MGLVLGFFRWRTGSLLPGIVLHAVHNGLLIGLAYYEPPLIFAQFQISEGEHLPAAWIAAGAAGVSAGLSLLYGATRQSRMSNV